METEAPQRDERLALVVLGAGLLGLAAATRRRQSAATRGNWSGASPERSYITVSARPSAFAAAVQWPSTASNASEPRPRPTAKRWSIAPSIP